MWARSRGGGCNGLVLLCEVFVPNSCLDFV